MSEKLNVQEFTPVQRALLGVLNDGERHSRDELRVCMANSSTKAATLRSHISLLRKRLVPKGHDIVCELNNGVHYRMVRLLASANDGRR